MGTCIVNGYVHPLEIWLSIRNVELSSTYVSSCGRPDGRKSHKGELAGGIVYNFRDELRRLGA